jgi:hypothetical protein
VLPSVPVEASHASLTIEQDAFDIMAMEECRPVSDDIWLEVPQKSRSITEMEHTKPATQRPAATINTVMKRDS